jgi:ribonuclease HI
VCGWVFWGFDESLFPIIAPRLLGEVLGELQRPTTIYTNESKNEGLIGIGIFLDDRDSCRLRLPGHCRIFNAEMCAIHFAFDLIESKPMGAYIILTDSLASIEELKSTGISYRTNDMLFRTRRSLRYLGELDMMWIPSHVGIQGNERADILAKEGSTSGTLFQDQAELTTVNTSDIHTRARTRLLTEWQERWNDSEMGRLLSRLSRLAFNHTSQCAMGYDTIDHGLWECGLHCALRNELQEKLRAAGIDHGSSIRDILAMRNMVALRLIFEYSIDLGLHI